MELRPYQERVVTRALADLDEVESTLCVLPTGAGKTIILSAIGGRFKGRPVLVLQHRDELVDQNRAKFERVNPGMATSEWTATQKRWANHGATFAMIQTLVKWLESMPAFALIIIDEAHHARAATYRRILEVARRKNPEVRVLGMTATPNRADKKGLGVVFQRVADVVTIGELIARGYLVEPRAFVLDVGVSDDLRAVRKTKIGEYDMAEVAKAIDATPVTDRVIALWREKAGTRRTVVFCATKDHALHVTAAFVSAGVRALCVTDDTARGERKAIMRAIDRGEAQVLVNVGVATEGFDCPPISCVVLLRPSSFQSTLIQMIGRGLRPVNPIEHPGIIKSDCIVLDFGRSLLEQGGIEQVCNLHQEPPAPSGVIRAVTKMCPGPEDPKAERCRKEIPVRARECPLCGFPFPVESTTPRSLEEMRLIELDLLIGESPFAWFKINERAFVANAFETWALAFEYRPDPSAPGVWHAFGSAPDTRGRPVPLAQGTQLVCLQAGDDWMRRFGDKKAAGKRREWLGKKPTDRQVTQLMHLAIPTRGLNRYEASCRITAKFAKRAIEKQLEELHARLPGLEQGAPA